MPYYLVSQSTGRIVTDGQRPSGIYKTMAAAKAARTRLADKQKASWSDLIVTAVESYQPRMVERVNIMTGQKYMEDVNTPRSCSPASELYWSM